MNNKSFLFLFFLASLFLMPTILGATANITVNMLSPDDAYSSDYNSTIRFSCNAVEYGLINISNLTLSIYEATENFTDSVIASANSTTLIRDLTLPNGVYSWKCIAGSLNGTISTSLNRTFTLNVPNYRTNNVYLVMEGSGAGLGIFLTYLGQVIGVLLIPLALVFFIVMLIYTISGMIKNGVKVNSKK